METLLWIGFAIVALAAVAAAAPYHRRMIDARPQPAPPDSWD